MRERWGKQQHENERGKTGSSARVTAKWVHRGREGERNIYCIEVKDGVREAEGGGVRVTLLRLDYTELQWNGDETSKEREEWRRRDWGDGWSSHFISLARLMKHKTRPYNSVTRREKQWKKQQHEYITHCSKYLKRMKPTKYTVTVLSLTRSVNRFLLIKYRGSRFLGDLSWHKYQSCLIWARLWGFRQGNNGVVRQ